MLSQFMGTRLFLKLMQTHFMEQRDVLIQNAVIESWKYQLNAELKGENMSGGNSEDVALSLEQEVQREMFLSMDGIIKENKRTR